MPSSKPSASSTSAAAAPVSVSQSTARPAVRPMLLSGLEPLVIGNDSLFINIGDKITIDTRTGEYLSRCK